MIDLSDGLCQDLTHILKASHVGAHIHLECLPIDSALHDLPLTEQWQYALAGGDDYELCFTISPENYSLLSQMTVSPAFTVIGQIHAELGLNFTYHNQKQMLDLHGYQHFA